jgi:hypothetical protein
MFQVCDFLKIGAQMSAVPFQLFFDMAVFGWLSIQVKESKDGWNVYTEQITVYVKI